ncbi:hypothetical protein WMY93_011041 [Mugilogobius chulae]|uniref:C2H2-type domain-containing protein n=1 Tax=Mugilogobius chulae TaxID=88201 RepID=A0AAW0PI02_9GOBI
MVMDMHLQPEEERKFKCDECGRTYKHAGSLSNHKKTHDIGSFQCNICGKENSNALALKNHLRSHTSQKKYPCLECGKTFYRPSQLVTHEKVHELRHTEGQSPIEVVMEYVTHEDQNGKADCFRSSGISTLYRSPDSITDVVCNSQIECNDFVGKRLKSDLDNKLYSHHTKTLQTGMFECTVCFKLFNDMAALCNHQRTHKSNGPEDSLCGPISLSLLDQLSPQNQDILVNFCHLCQVAFSSVDEFRSHIQMHNSSPLLDQNDSAFNDSSNGFYESPFNQLPIKHMSSASSRNYSGSFDMPITDNGPLYNCSNLESTSLYSTQVQPSASGPSQNNNTIAIDGTSDIYSEERPFKCDICFKTYRHNGSLINHRRSHQIGDYQCSICGKRCPHLASLKSHLRIHKVASSHCREQNWLSSQLQTLEDGQPTSPNMMHVDIELKNESLLNGFLNQDTVQTFDFDVHFPQQQNGVSSNFVDSNEQHPDNVKSQSKPFDFHEINDNGTENNLKSPENVSNNSYHGADDEEEGDDRDFYQCSFCGNRYNSIGALRNHMRGHIQSPSSPLTSIPTKQVKEEEFGNVISCCLCEESFSNSQDLVNHQLLHSTDQLDNIENADKKCEVNDEKSLICGRCGIFCTSYSHLENHGCKVDTSNQSITENKEETREPNSNADKSSDKKERHFKCDQCGRSYRHACSLLNHKKSHKTGLFRCHICQKNLYNLLALKSHQRSHFDIKRYKCDECGRAYKTQKQLLTHLKRHRKGKLINSMVQIPPQTKERSSGEVRSLSANDSQDFPSESKEFQEFETRIKPTDNRDKRPFECDLCGRTYRHAGSLTNHKKAHKTGEYLCSICNNSYSNQLAMKNHLRSHFAFKRHSCLKCGKRLRSRKQLLVHVCTNRKRGKRGLRSKCTKSSVSCGQTTEPSTKETRFFTCNICNRSYRHAGSLLNHKNTHKTGHYNCTFCSKHFSNLLALRNHTRIHTQKKKHVCLTCGKAFRVASVLYNHQKIHNRGAGRLSCLDCGRSFRGRAGLKRHQCPQGELSGTLDQQSDKCFKCDLCGRSYHHAGSLLNHKKTHSENFHHCSLCLQTFPDPLSLHAHSQINRHCCLECGKIFCLLSHLQSHMEVHSKEQKTHNDEIFQNGLENGVLRDPNQNAIKEKTSPKTDSEIRPMFVKIAVKEFTNLMALKNHRRIHTEPKRYQCLECGKAFRASSQLMCHKRIHTRERPYTCSICDKSFSNKSNLTNHEKMHQNIMDAYSFSFE